MAHLENGSYAARAFVRANANKFLEGKPVIFSGLLGTAYRDKVLDPESVANAIGVNQKTARNWSEYGREPNKKTQRRVVKLILAEPT